MVNFLKKKNQFVQSKWIQCWRYL